MRPVVAAFVLAAMLTGCGYSPRGTLPEHIKTVAVPVFKNRTLQPGIEAPITAAIVAAFSKRLRVVPLPQADAILDGEVVSYSAEGLSFDRRFNVNSYRVSIVVNIEFRDVRQNAVLWKEVGITQESDFSVQGSVADTIAREASGAGLAAEQIGNRVVNAVMERF